MLYAPETIFLYEKISEITEQMLIAAHGRDWEAMKALELSCSKQVDILKSRTTTQHLSPQLRQHKVKVLQKILANDRSIRDLTQPWMNELSTLINALGHQQKLNKSYAPGESN